MRVDKYKRNAVSVTFDDFMSKDNNVEVTEWMNGEGFDVSVQLSTGMPQTLSLTYGAAAAVVAALQLVNLGTGDDE